MAAGKRAARPEPKRRGQVQSPNGRHRAVKPRYGRIALATCAAVVTMVAVVGGFGWLPHGDSGSAAAATGQAIDHGTGGTPETTAPTTPTTPASTPLTTRASDRTVPDTSGSDPTPLPADSGSGRRVVFSQSQQTVWLVNHNDGVRRSYRVSGSVTDNLDPGTYQVYSRSRWAVGVDDSGTMQYFVRFAHGPTGAAIGFHSIPQKNGEPLQTRSQLGTPQSHGCIRQAIADAIQLWHFAPVGTTVVVTA